MHDVSASKLASTQSMSSGAINSRKPMNRTRLPLENGLVLAYWEVLDLEQRGDKQYFIQSELGDIESSDRHSNLNAFVGNRKKQI